MKRPKCIVYEPSKRYARKVVRDLRFDGSDLVLQIQGDGFSFATVTFKNVIGFRVLDERDLCEFWNEYSEPNGWLYEVESGGWLELESQRELFNSPSLFDGLKEYFVVDDNCINVLCTRAPEIRDQGAEPSVGGDGKPAPQP